MKRTDGGRLYTVHICQDCGHRDMDHAGQPHGTNTCSYGWCKCRVSKATVQNLNPAEERMTLPGVLMG